VVITSLVALCHIAHHAQAAAWYSTLIAAFSAAAAGLTAAGITAAVDGPAMWLLLLVVLLPLPLRLLPTLLLLLPRP
jgi:hypothetical protein